MIGTRIFLTKNISHEYLDKQLHIFQNINGQHHLNFPNRRTFKFPPCKLLQESQEHEVISSQEKSKIKSMQISRPVKIKDSIFLEKDTDINRRRALKNFMGAISLTSYLTSREASPALAATDTSYTDKMKLGKGVWNDNDKTIMNFSSSDLTDVNNLEYDSIPPSFFNYACRFLIQYDPAMRNMWDENLQKVSKEAMSAEEQQQIDDFFNSLVGVVHNAILLFLSSKEKIDDGKTGFEQLAQIFISKYCENGISQSKNVNVSDSVERHIGILFSLLPAENQPITELRKIESHLDMQTFKNELSLPQDKYALLPHPYTIGYSSTSNSFRLKPELTEPLDGISPLEFSTISSDGDNASNASIGITNLKPLTRTRPTFTPTIYALFGLAGGLGCSLTHTVVVPLDVVKTRMQTDPMFLSEDSEASLSTNDGQGKQNKIMESAKSILEKEGVSGLFLGFQATILGYLWYGVSVYPSYTFFKRTLCGLLPLLVMGDTGNFEEIIALLAGAMSAVLASLGLTPLEACRIRAVAEPQTYAPLGVTGTAAVIASENPALGLGNLYAGFPSLLTRQVVFGSMKFLAFEKAFDAINLIAPSDWSAAGSAGSLTISLLAGGFAGCISSIVSQPADCVLTYVARNSSEGKALGVIDGCKIMVAEGGVGTLYRGLGSRCVWAGSIIAGQFLLYDVFRAMFGVDSESLKQVFQIVIDS